MFESHREKEIEAAAFESAVRQALIKVYGKPADPTTAWRSVLSSFLPKGARLEYMKPDPLAVLVLTEFSWVKDPLLSRVDFSRWQKVSAILVQQGWKTPGWDSINPAVHVIYAEASPGHIELSEGSIMASSKSNRVTLLVEDTSSGDRSKLSFPYWQDAHDHIRQVILGQIIEQLVELALQDDPSKFKEEIEQLKEIGHDVNYPRDLEALRYAVEQWKEFTDGHAGFVVVEIL
jgi:hypothetical protein